MVVDLRDVDLPAGRTDLNVDVGLGEAVLYVPSDACITSDVQVGAGGSDILDSENNGVDVDYVDEPVPPEGRPELHVEADIGVGVIEVVREGFFRDQFTGNHFDRFGNPDPVDLDGGTKCA